MDIEVPSTPSRLLRISTEMFPERERFSAFREEFARRILAIDVIDRSGGRPHIEVTFLRLGPAAVGTHVSAPAEFIRDKHHLRDGSDAFLLGIVEAGPIRYAHAGEERTCDADSAYFFDQRRPWRGFGLCTRRSVRHLAVRPAAPRTLVSHPDDLSGRAGQPCPALRLPDGYPRPLTPLHQP